MAVNTGLQAPVAWLCLVMLRLYAKAISPLLGCHCRFMPSCSAYARQAIETHGVGKGFWLTLKRLWRCRPGGEFGYDPVPEINERASQ